MPTININPVTRIEGHARITVQLDEHGEVQGTRFHATQLRGFEKLCEGRPFTEMPVLMARICGICPTSHLLASSKACDEIMAVRIPATAEKLRSIMNLAQIIQSHALSFFYLSSPDLLLGMDASPEERNIMTLIRKFPAMARAGITLRMFGQRVLESLGGRRIHPGWIVPGGVSHPLDVTHRDQIVAELPEAQRITLETLRWFKEHIERFRAEINSFANFPSMFLALANERNELSFDGGWLRFIDSNRSVVADHISCADYMGYIGESSNDDSYLKSTYFKPLGLVDGMYRVGPLARLNICHSAGTSQADEELAHFRDLERPAVLSSFYYHYARLVEILFCIERMQTLLHDPEILGNNVRAHASPNNREGVGIIEAPRGTLIHHYRIDQNGNIEWANLIVATGHNNLAINHGVLQVARQFVHGSKVEQGMLNRVEAVVRAFDPCLSCSTHAAGTIPLEILVISADGDILERLKR